MKLDGAMTEDDIAAALKTLDADGNGEISFSEFSGWWEAEKGGSSAPAQAMSVKDRMRALMQQQAADAEVAKTDFAADLQDVDLAAKKAAMDKSLSEQKHLKKQWDVDEDLKDRETTAAEQARRKEEGR